MIDTRPAARTLDMMTDAGNALEPSSRTPPIPPLSVVERGLLCQTLEEVGPDAPTLCDGWTAHDLVAHIYAREANPFLAATAPIPPLSNWVATRISHSNDFGTLIERVRNGPPRILTRRLRRLEPQVNTLEFYIHHEDVLRAAPSWEPRVLPPWAEDEIWARVAGLASLVSRRKKAVVTFERSDTGMRSSARTDADVVLRGLPSEIALHASGRARVSRVEVLRPAPAVAGHRLSSPEA